ncbi:MAG: archaetidylserine decarboxylase [Candidatus Competibacterales bacterium]|nr:archaetidylserine decarboxylase [Candidatus Competibacterales bacterium]
MNAAGPTLADRLGCLPQYLLPQRRLTRLVYRLTRIRTPWFKNALIRVFRAAFRVDLDEAESPDPHAYAHFNAFFTRALRAGSRPLSDAGACCPVDGTVSQAGRIEAERLYQAKGRDYTLSELLADETMARAFHDGHFATLYLAPRDYHRIHMPVAGQLVRMIHIPGRLFSVSPLTTRVIPRLFARNERVVCLFDTDHGPLGLVLVGAINVASIETVWAGAITPPLGTAVQRWDYPAEGAQQVSLARGAELGRFNMGSTVIVLTAAGALRLADGIRPGARVRMGQALGQFLDSGEDPSC